MSSPLRTSALRLPAVAGRFYPDSPERLRQEICQYTSKVQPRSFAIGCIAPHAGYIYSGHVAGAVYSQLEIPEHCIVLCPNHTGRGVPLSIMTSTAWQTPLGEVAPSTDIASRLLSQFSGLEEDSGAHRGEHAIEVQLPFLQERKKNLHLVPIAIGTRDFHTLHELGEALASVIGDREDILIIASSDMNHYESDAITRVKDHKAIDRILALDARGLWEVVMREDISMCGFGPAVAMLTAAKILGASKAAVVRYATSGDISGDRDAVVGYAGIVVE
ncbi:MAG TPA: AmmeMemoRadiSam system protein B [Terriglobales bacterium]|nr:AmmeMemoRadiSam system protein B [Terriglobales bacterium]